MLASSEIQFEGNAGVQKQTSFRAIHRCGKWLFLGGSAFPCGAPVRSFLRARTRVVQELFHDRLDIKGLLSHPFYKVRRFSFLKICSHGLLGRLSAPPYQAGLGPLWLRKAEQGFQWVRTFASQLCDTFTHSGRQGERSLTVLAGMEFREYLAIHAMCGLSQLVTGQGLFAHGRSVSLLKNFTSLQLRRG